MPGPIVDRFGGRLGKAEPQGLETLLTDAQLAWLGTLFSKFQFGLMADKKTQRPIALGFMGVRKSDGQGIQVQVPLHAQLAQAMLSGVVTALSAPPDEEGDKDAGNGKGLKIAGAD